MLTAEQLDWMQMLTKTVSCYQCRRLHQSNLYVLVLLTEPLYWGMVEASLGLFAACLPMLWVLFDGFSIESMTTGLRSRFSLQQLRNRNSADVGSRDLGHPVGSEKPLNARDHSTASHARILRKESEEITDGEDF